MQNLGHLVECYLRGPGRHMQLLVMSLASPHQRSTSKQSCYTTLKTEVMYHLEVDRGNDTIDE